MVAQSTSYALCKSLCKFLEMKWACLLEMLGEKKTAGYATPSFMNKSS